MFNELYQLEVRKRNDRTLKECMLCNVIVNSETGKMRGFATRMTQVSFDAKIYISGIFDQKLNRLSILEVSKGILRKPNLYLFKDINAEGEYRDYSREYRFMYPKPTGSAFLHITKLLPSKEVENLEKKILSFLSDVDEQKEKETKKIGGINLTELEEDLAYYNFFL